MDPFVILISEELYTLVWKSTQIVVSIGILVCLCFTGEKVEHTLLWRVVEAVEYNEKKARYKSELISFIMNRQI